MTKPSPVPVFILRSHLGAVTALCFVKETGLRKECLQTYMQRPFLLSGSDVGEIFVWNLKTYRVQCKLDGHDGKMVSWLSYYQGNIISQGRDGFVKLWSILDETWTIIREIPVSGIGFCSPAILVCDNNSYLATVDHDACSISIMDFGTTEVKSVLKPYNEACGMCMCLKIFVLQNDIFIICGYENGSILLWNCQQSKVISSLICHKETVMCLDFDENTRQGISGSADEHLVVWKMDDNLNLIQKKQIKLTNPGVACVAIRPDSKIVLSGGWDGKIRVFSWKTLKSLAVLSCHSDTINYIHFSSHIIGKNRSTFAAGSKDKNISLWSLY